MWDGPGHGPRGGPPFRGDHRGDMFRGRSRPMSDYRGRGGMHMGHMGPRHHDGPPMDMRMDGPPMRGHDMDSREMRGREPNRDFFGPGREPDFRRPYESPRDKPMYPSGFGGPGRDSGEMGGIGMHEREQNRFMEMQEREPFYRDMPWFNNPHSDGGRGFPMNPLGEHDGFSYDRLPMGNDDSGRFDMNLPPRERRMMDSERRGGGPPFNPRGRFDSDIDFRNRPGPPAEFRGRDRSPLMFGENDVPPMDRERPDMPLDVSGPQHSHYMGTGDGNADYPDSSDSPVMDYRSGEEMTLAEEWKNRQKDKNPFLGKGLGSLPETGFSAGFGRNLNVDKPCGNFADRVGPFPHLDPPPLASKPPQDHLLPEISPLTGQILRENKPNRIESTSHQSENKEPSLEVQEPKDRFERMRDLQRTQGASADKLGGEPNRTAQGKDQDYRDIDYRTGPGRLFEYKHEELQTPESLLKDPKQDLASKFTDSGSQDQDYRSATIKEKVSNVISISGIPKTATMEQILGAFAVRDDVPMQGMKIRNVVPGYSYDMAYVEFLNLEDAVHFMESNKVAHPRHSTKAVLSQQEYEGLRGHSVVGNGGEMGSFYFNSLWE